MMIRETSLIREHAAKMTDAAEKHETMRLMAKKAEEERQNAIIGQEQRVEVVRQEYRVKKKKRLDLISHKKKSETLNFRSFIFQVKLENIQIGHAAEIKEYKKKVDDLENEVIILHEKIDHLRYQNSSLSLNALAHTLQVIPSSKPLHQKLAY